MLYVRNVCHNQTKKCLPHIWFSDRTLELKLRIAFMCKYQTYCYCQLPFSASIKNIYNYMLGMNYVSRVYKVTVQYSYNVCYT
jgi:hypothetical protein